MKIKSSILFFIIQVVFSITSVAQENAKVADINKLMIYCNARGFFNGVILVAEDQKVIYKKALGYSNLENGTPLQTEDQFYLGSVSKQFTSMAIRMRKEKGLLDYEDHLLKFFPDFPKFASEVTVRHLLTHTSGIPDYYNLGIYKAGLRNQDVYETLVKLNALDFTPGAKYSYSNSGYVLLSMIIEKVSGQTFAEFLKEHIFNPLGMDNTLVYDETMPEIARRVTGYNQQGRKDDYTVFTTGAGGIYSNVDDLFKWEQSLYQPMLIKKETLQEAYTPFRLNNDSLSYYGFGWNLPKDPAVLRYWHTGSLVGFRTYLERDITKKNTIIFLTNMGDAVKREEIYLMLRNILDGKEYRLPREDKFIVQNYINVDKYREANMNLAPDADKRVVFMGNSITEAWTYISPAFFDNNPYVGRGISGQVTQQMLLRFRRDVIDLKPMVVVILAGTNDIAQNSGYIANKDILQNIISMTELAQFHGIKVILCSVLPAIDFPWSPGLLPAKKIIDLNEMIKKYAAEKEIIYVDYYSAMADDKGGLKVPDYTSATDLVHPNKEGYKVMEELIKPAIQKALGN